MDTKANSLQTQIEQVKAQVVALGPLRPGSLSRQARARGGTYFQLAYSHNGKGHTEYVREDYVQTIRQEIENHRTLKQLIRRWVALELQLSQRRQRHARQTRPQACQEPRDPA